MARMRSTNANNHSYRTSTCVHCGASVTNRKSEAVPDADPGQYVLAVDKFKQPVTRRALPRQHRKGEGCRA